MKEAQSKQIKNFLLSGNPLTAIEALKRFGCFRLAARINDLKKAGLPVKSEIIKLPDGKRIAVYSIGTINF